jgi:hypothetical protein
MAKAPSELADASPEKRLFISLLTRDITLIDAILGLIDNCINSAIISKKVRLDRPEDYIALLTDKPKEVASTIDISLSASKFVIDDAAGGIDFDTAKNEVFKFGRDPETFSDDDDRLSVYGIGLKRAMFKIGKRVKIESNHPQGGFHMDLNVPVWARDRAQPWHIPISHYKEKALRFGTKITISDFFPDVRTRFDDSTFVGELTDRIGKTYSYFLDRVVTIRVNRSPVPPLSLEIGSNFTSDTFTEDRVTCSIVAGLARPKDGRYVAENAGWFVFCNGRAVASLTKAS